MQAAPERHAFGGGLRMNRRCQHGGNRQPRRSGDGVTIYLDAELSTPGQRVPAALMNPA
jgi:hypothetical protein